MSKLKQSMDTASIGLEMGGCVAVGYLLGTWCDERFGTAPWGLVFFLVAGFGAALKGLIRVARTARRDMAVQPAESRVLDARLPGGTPR